jgi:magnesium chelatase family protein
MLARVFSCAVVGLDGVIVEVEVDYTNGLPATIIVGLPDAAVQESRERVQTAIKNAGLHFPRHRIVVNLAPASVRKEGPAYDLPIALGVIILSGRLPFEAAQDMIVVGELSLDGVVRHTRGILPMAAAARSNGYKRMAVSEADAAEAALIPDLEIIPVKTLAHLYDHLTGRQLIEPFQASGDELPPLFVPTDFAEVKGQEHVKRALEVAAAGGHNALMAGAPGSGKTLLARAMPGILPEMSIDESLDVTRIYSVADQLPPDTPLIKHRPFRAPHHTISHAGLVGGGNIPHPGEISLPLPLRILRRFPKTLHMQSFDRDQVPETHLRPHARPHRHPHRSPARGLREAEQRPAGGELGSIRERVQAARERQRVRFEGRTSSATPTCAWRKCANSVNWMKRGIVWCGRR